MKYFIDTEFLEGKQKERFPISLFRKQTPNTIDLISIGIVAEDGRMYYAISKDFNLYEAWNRYDEKISEYTEFRFYQKEHKGYGTFCYVEYNEDVKKEIKSICKEFDTTFELVRNKGDKYKDYWIRENVLKPIYYENVSGDERNRISFSYEGMKSILKRKGKSNNQIAEEIKDFCTPTLTGHNLKDNDIEYNKNYSIPEFYAYYADYDWVAFCWLFGKMIDLPKGFPMYCIDLKQTIDDKISKIAKLHGTNYSLKELKTLPNYPKQYNNHNALADALWNKELYHFLQTI